MSVCCLTAILSYVVCRYCIMFNIRASVMSIITKAHKNKTPNIIVKSNLKYKKIFMHLISSKLV